MTTPVPSVELRLPSVLKMAVGKDLLAVSGRTVHEALRSAFEQLPQLENHLMVAARSEEIRPHILCVVNGISLRRDEVAGFELNEGDEILIHQAISGG